MSFRSPFLSLDQLQQARSDAAFQRASSLGNSFSKTALDLDSLQREEEDRKKKYDQQMFENQQKMAQSARETARDKSSADYQNRTAKVQEEAATRNNQLADQTLAKEGLQDARTLLSKHVAAGIAAGQTPEQVAQAAHDVPGLADITGDEEVQAEYAKQVQDRADRDTLLGIKEDMASAGMEKADAAMKNANRVRTGPGAGGKDNPRFAGMSPGFEKDVRDATVNLQSLDDVEQSVRTGKADPGPVSNVMATVRQFMGIRNTGDDATRAQLAGVVNGIMHDNFGSAVSAHEMERALMELPSFKDDQEGFLALIGNLRRKYARKINATVDVASKNAAARGAKSDIAGQFPKLDVDTGKPAGTAGAAPPRDPSMSRREYAVHLVNDLGFSKEDALQAAMSAP